MVPDELELRAPWRCCSCRQEGKSRGQRGKWRAEGRGSREKKERPGWSPVAYSGVELQAQRGVRAGESGAGDWMGKTREADAVIGGSRGVTGWVEKDREGIPRGFGGVAAQNRKDGTAPYVLGLDLLYTLVGLVRG